MSDDIAWEHKTLNKELIPTCRKGIVPVQYHLQLEQQLLVSGAGCVLFMASNGTGGNRAACVVRISSRNCATRSLPAEAFAKRRCRLSRGVGLVPVAAPIMDLLAASVQIEGTGRFCPTFPPGERLQSFIAGLNPAPGIGPGLPPMPRTRSRC